MADWAKIKFLYETMLGSSGSVLTATSTATGGYAADYIYNMLEVNAWKAASAASPQYISYDAGIDGVKTADYIAILGHNLKTVGAAIGLQYSDDNFAAHVWNAFTSFIPTTDGVILKEFTSPGAYRYWRLVFSGMSGAPYATIAVWGSSTELDYATASFDPHCEEVKASVNLSYSGCVTGVHTRYTERGLALRFDDADAELYEKVMTWRGTSGLKNFFVAWEGANRPTDVWLMRPDARFANPLKSGGLYRDISIQLKGRKE